MQHGIVKKQDAVDSLERKRKSIEETGSATSASVAADADAAKKKKSKTKTGTSKK